MLAPATLWLAVHLPLLPLEAWRATLPEALCAGRPLVLVAGQRVSHVDAAAAARGIRVGMKRATAAALAADVLPGAADAARDAAALQAVVHVALAFTPAVVPADAATVLLEVQSCLRLFGGLAALVQRLRAALAPLGHRLQLAAAPTPLGAALLARWSPAGRGDLLLGAHATRLPAFVRLLDDAPLALLEAGRAHGEALQGMGLQTLGELRALPRAGLARRCGEGLLHEIDRALGQRADPRRWIEPPARFDSRLELYARAESAEQVLSGAAVLLARLVAWAQARHGRIGAFTLAMLHEPRHGTVDRSLPATELCIELAEPALDAAHLHLLLRERLARVQLAAPTLELRLRCPRLVIGAPPNGELFPTRQSEQQGLLRLLERLRARLGDEGVQRLVPLADHRPEHAGRGVPALGARPAGDAPAVRRCGAMRVGMGSAAGRPGAAAVPAQMSGPAHMGATAGAGEGAASALPLHRPAWLLPQPLPLSVRGMLPLLDGREVQLVSGPERIEAGWWDGDLVARDYFIGQADDGSLLWLWRGRLPAAPGEVQWFLHGRFA